MVFGKAVVNFSEVSLKFPYDLLFCCFMILDSVLNFFPSEMEMEIIKILARNGKINIDKFWILLPLFPATLFKKFVALKQFPFPLLLLLLSLLQSSKK